MRESSMLDRRTFVAGAGAVLGGGAVGTARGGDVAPDTSERPTVVAHRGFGDVYPENTVGAFEFASEGVTDDAADRRRADWIELDVRPTREGEIAVFHDENLEDLTDAAGVIYEQPAETVFSAEVLESGETVPTLRESMEAIPRRSASTSISRTAPRTSNAVGSTTPGANARSGRGSKP